MAQKYERKLRKVGRDGIGFTLQARQILPSVFSYEGVACELRTTTNFLTHFCK
jgi:hypothetical protein